MYFNIGDMDGDAIENSALKIHGKKKKKTMKQVSIPHNDTEKIRTFVLDMNCN